jgi:hypothetical protein
MTFGRVWLGRRNRKRQMCQGDVTWVEREMCLSHRNLKYYWSRIKPWKVKMSGEKCQRFKHPKILHTQNLCGKIQFMTWSGAFILWALFPQFLLPLRLLDFRFLWSQPILSDVRSVFRKKEKNVGMEKVLFGFFEKIEQGKNGLACLPKFWTFKTSVARFSWYILPKPENVPNEHKMYQMVIKCPKCL